MVKPGRFVLGKVAGIGGAVAVIAIAAYVFRYTDAGTKILESLKGAGIVGGQALIAPITGLVGGVTEGINSLAITTGESANQLLEIGANFQRFVSGGKTWAESIYGDNPADQVSTQTSLIAQLRQQLDTSSPFKQITQNQNYVEGAFQDQNAFNQQAVENRLVETIKSTLNKAYSADYGGYQTASEQEAALRREIEATRSQYSQWFV